MHEFSQRCLGSRESPLSTREQLARAQLAGVGEMEPGSMVEQGEASGRTSALLVGLGILAVAALTATGVLSAGALSLPVLANGTIAANQVVVAWSVALGLAGWVIALLLAAALAHRALPGRLKQWRLRAARFPTVRFSAETYGAGNTSSTSSLKKVRSYLRRSSTKDATSTIEALSKLQEAAAGGGAAAEVLTQVALNLLPPTSAPALSSPPP